ncbi:MAG TPA: hypothetical protein VNA16_00765 [Abditibacteriaceae bacterium]|nr:hypothetical protein [Abditibacteriaceae bacterium]
MGFEIDNNLHWTDHYVEHGFCVVKGALDKDFCRRGIAAFQKELGTDLPPQQWSTTTLHHKHHSGRMSPGAGLQPFIESVYDEPGLRAAIDTMVGGFDVWSGERSCQPFLCVFDPANEPSIPRRGHIDFLEVRIPILGNGFAFQAALIDTEPFSGNITIYPGYHKIIPRKLLEEPGFWFSGKGPRHEAWVQLVPEVEPYEFVAEAGDVLFFHHLVGHEGNVNAAAHHTPRVAIHGQVSTKQWLQEIDPARPDLSPFERSLALNGAIKLPFDEQAAQQAAYAERKFRWQMEKWAEARKQPATATP